MNNLYMLSYNAEMANPIQKQLVTFLKNISQVEKWHSPFDGIIFIKSSNDVFEISNLIGEFFNDSVGYILIQIDRANLHGQMVASTWEWVKKNLPENPSRSLLE